MLTWLRVGFTSKVKLLRDNDRLSRENERLSKDNSNLRTENAHLGIAYDEINRLVGADVPVKRGMRLVLCGGPYVVKGVGRDEVHLRHDVPSSLPIDVIAKLDPEEEVILDLQDADKVQ